MSYWGTGFKMHVTVLRYKLNSSCSTCRSGRFSSARPHLTHWPGMRPPPRSWTAEQQSLPYQESSCDYCNTNQPVITLRACQALDRVLWEPPFSSMWPHSWQKSHPVTARASFELPPAGICWLRYPSSSYCPSSNLLTQNIFNLSFSQKRLRGPPGLVSNFSKKRHFQKYVDQGSN